MRRIAVAVAIPLAAQAANGALQGGVEAYLRGDHAAQLDELRTKARQGDTSAQLLLGFIFDKGTVVPANHAEAASGIASQPTREMRRPNITLASCTTPDEASR